MLLVAKKERTKRPKAKVGDPPLRVLRKLKPEEKLSHWIKQHLGILESLNLEGWRWAQIADSLTLHLGKKLTRNKLTGMVTMIRQNKLSKHVEQEI